MHATRNRTRTWLLLMVLILAGIAHGEALAQEITGSLQGTVVSASGSPEPQVVITLSGPNLQGTRATATDTRGFYQFLAVPPGTYTLHLTRVGLQPIDVQQVTVELGRTTAVPTLKTAAQPIVMEAVVVQAPRITLDPAHTGAGGTLRTQECASLPIDRDYKSVIALLPQANTSYRGDPVNVAGSTGLENQYYIDGVNVTDPHDGSRGTSLPHNFVRAVEVKTGGYEAQFGRALGAIVNAVTYSGTNDFEMSFFGFTQPSGLAMDARVAPGVSVQQPVSYDFGALLGGPLVRDRLWYSAAVNPRTDQVDKEIVGFGSFADRTKAVRFASKLTWRASSATNVELSVFGDPTVRDQVDPLPSGVATMASPDGLLARVESGGTTASLRASVAPSASVLLQGSLSRQWDRYSEQPATSRGRSEPAYFDYPQSSYAGGRQGRFAQDRGRTSLTARGTLLVPGHTVVAGVDYEDLRLVGSSVTDRIYRTDTSLFLRDQQSSRGTFHTRSPAAYLQDSWRVTDRLTVNPGLRWSGQYLTGASGRTAQRINDEWQPRAGFSWQVGPTGTQRLFGSYGRFYQTLPTALASVNYVDYLMTYSYYSTDPRQSGATPDSVFDYSSYESDFAKQIPGLHAENFDEFTLGYERLIGEEAKLTVRGMRRSLRSSFQLGMDVSQDPIWILGTPGRGNFSFLPPPKRDYTALEIAAEGSWRSSQYRASYVLSRARGNYPGLWNSDFGFGALGQMTTFMMPHQAQNSTGLLPNDRTHVFKLNGACTWRFGLVTGAVLTYETGSPINDFAAGPQGPLGPSFLVPRGSAGRTPALWDLGLRLAYDLPITPGPRVQFLLDLLHVGNPRRAVTVDELHYATLDENGNPSSPNERYKQATAYQPPMAVCLGIQARL